MPEVREVLEGLGLSEYTDAVIGEGFDTFEVLKEITETDLTELQFKLGHRRKLQRALSDLQREEEEDIARKNSAINGHRSGQSTHPTTSDSGELASDGAHLSSVGPVRTKRKYKRHPKTDPSSPERPASAYVLFSNQMREGLKDREFSFTEMAKVVGERWQVLPTNIRDSFERQAATSKEKFNNEMVEYKKTESYAQYQEYLAAFKAKVASDDKSDNKRAKAKNADSTGSISSKDTPERATSDPRHEIRDRRKSAASHYSAASDRSDGAYSQDPQSATFSPHAISFSNNLPSFRDQHSYGPPTILHSPITFPSASSQPATRSTHIAASNALESPNSIYSGMSSPSSTNPPDYLSHPGSTSTTQRRYGDPYAYNSSQILPSMSRELTRRNRDIPEPPAQAFGPMRGAENGHSSRMLPTPVNSHSSQASQKASLAALLRAGELAIEADRNLPTAQPPSARGEGPA